MGETDKNCSYMKQVYKELLSEEWNTGLSERYLRLNYNDPYKSLKEYAAFRLQKYANKHYRVAEEFCLKMAGFFFYTFFQNSIIFYAHINNTI